MGTTEDLEHVVTRLRQAWPGVRIHVRGDSGLGVPRVYEACERFDVDYAIGLGMNSRLKRLSDPLLNEVVACFQATGEPQRFVLYFLAFTAKEVGKSVGINWTGIAK